MTHWTMALSGALCVIAILFLARCLSSLFCHPKDPIDDHLWVGLLALISITYLTNFFLPLSHFGNRIVIWGAVMVGFFVWVKRSTGRRKCGDLRSAVFAVLCFVFIVTCLGAVAMKNLENYDTGLYHFASIEALKNYRVIPGWANLHLRHAGHSSAFNLAAVLELGPWGSAGYRLTSAVFSSISILTFWSSLLRFVGKKYSLGDSIILVGIPSIWSIYLFEYGGVALDAPAAIVSFVATAKACDVATAAAPKNSALAVAVSVLAFSLRPLNVVLVCACAGFVIWRARPRCDLPGKRVLALSLTLLVLHVVRSVVVSGYALFPTPVGLGALPWAVPRSAISAYASTVRGWARLVPGEAGASAMTSSSWISKWLIMQRPLFMGVLTVAFLSAVVIVLSRRDARVSLRFSWFAALVLAPITAWFVSAPEPRFAIGQIAVLSCFPFLIAGRCAPKSATVESRSGAAKRRTRAGRCIVGTLGLLLVAPSGSRFALGVASDGVPVPSEARVEWPAVEIVLEKENVSIVRPVVGDQCGRHVWCSPHVDPGLTVEAWSGWQVVSQAE